MTKRIFALIVAILMVATLFAGCGDKDDKKADAPVVTTPQIATIPKVTLPDIDVTTSDPLKGSWVGEDDGTEGTFTFNGDGTGTLEIMGFVADVDYTINGNSVIITTTFEDERETVELEFSVNGNTLTFTDGVDTMVFTKKGFAPSSNNNNTSSADALMGTWTGEEDGMTMTFTFNGDGTGSVIMMDIALEMTYTISGNELTYTIEFGGESESQTLEFSINGNEMVLTDGEYPVTFTRQ